MKPKLPSIKNLPFRARKVQIAADNLDELEPPAAAITEPPKPPRT